MGSYEALIQQLHSGPASQQLGAVAALSELPLTPRNWLTAVGAIPRLIQLLHSASTKAPQARTIRCLLERISDCREGEGAPAAPYGVIAPLVSLLLCHDEADGQRLVALTFSNLAMTISNRDMIVEAGAIVPLVQLLGSGSVALQQPAARALAYLAEGRSARAKIIAAGAMRPLLQLLRSSNLAAQLTAAMAVRVFAFEEPDSVVAAGAIPLLVQLLTSSSEEVHWMASVSLYYLARNVNNIAQVIAAGAIPLLAELLRTSGSTDVQREAARTLGTLALMAQSAVISAGAIEPLVRLLKDGSEDTQSAAALALVDLSSGNEACQAMIAAAGAIAPLVRVLRVPARSEELQGHAAALLANIASADAKSIVAAGALPFLVERLAAGSAETQEKAARAVNCIARDVDTHAAILAAAPLLPLVRLMTATSEGAWQQAHQALLHLSKSPTFPEHFVAAGAMPPLVQLLCSESAPLQQWAFGMLCHLATNGLSHILEPAKRAGALPLLAHLQTAASTEMLRFDAGKLLKALTTGKSPFDDDPETIIPSSLSSTVSSAHPESAAGSSSNAAAASSPPAAASAQQQQLPPRPRKSCWSCGATGVPLKKCSVCAVAAYCGADCQRADWRVHKRQCAGLEAGASGSGTSAAAAGEK